MKIDINLKGTINFRDLGGHITQDGRRVKKKRIFRSGNLSQLTAEDRSILESLGIVHVIDYRSHDEASREKNQVIRNAVYEVCPAAPATHAAAAAGSDFFSEANLSSLAADFMETFYQNLPFRNPAYKILFSRLENLESGALLHHCAVGKDRTGVSSALILLALNVPVETVIEEYRQSDQGLKPHHEKIFARVTPHLSKLAIERMHYATSAGETFIRSAFSAILKRYKSFEEYFHAEYDLDQKRLEALRHKYLDPK